jgi:ATP-dependent exoDNAse (exonuclease V) alpha subunit
MRQAQALGVMAQGNSVFLTGAAGSGKTYVLNLFIKHLKKHKKQVAVTASTGIAATHIGGTTIHSWSGLGIRDSLTEHDKTWLKGNDRLSKRYNSTDVLIIDEVSMLHGTRLDMINKACKLLRRSDAPFGGLQVILTGDLFQLPPVNRKDSTVDFAHTSAAWQELNPQICYLSEQHRQGKDELLGILEAMRARQVTDVHESALTGRLGLEPPEHMVLTRLYTHNVDVEAVNDRHLKAIVEEPHVYEMAASGRAKAVEQLQKSVLAPEILELKKGAEVMFVANNFAQGFVNGSRGRVIEFRGDTPVVELVTGKRKIAVEPHSWTLTEDGRERARVTQLPLRLAWAITIHKSQGMSLDGALIDLSRSFTYGMGYVALSRVRSIDGLFLSGLNNLALQLHPDIFAFDERLRARSDELAAETEDFSDTEEANPEEGINDELFKVLREWRTKQAQASKVPAFMIAHNSTLEAIASRQPQNEHQLLAVKGVGKKFVESYGPEILEFIKSHRTELPNFSDSEAHLNDVLDYIAGKGITLTDAKRQTITQALKDD